MLKTSAKEKTFFDDFIFRNFIPKDHKLVKIKDFLNLGFIPALVEDTYNNENPAGRNPIDPKILFMACLLEFIENLSDVEASKKIFEVPLYRYFVGLGLDDSIPDDSTLSFFRTQRMGELKFKEAFNQIVKQLFDAGLIDGKIQSQDATDIRGNIEILDSFGLLNKCRANILLAVKRLDGNLYKKWKYKYNFRITSKTGDKQKQFEKLIGVCKLLLKAALQQRKFLKDKRFHREVTVLHRAISERKDEYFDEEGKKQRKENEKKIVGKMINPSDPDASWGAKSDKKFFPGYKVESNLDHKYGIITAVEVDKAGHPEEKSATLLLEQQKDNLGIVPLHFTADAKYDYGNTRTEIRALQDDPSKPINLYIPLVPSKNKEGGLTWDNFYFENGHLFCPAGFPAESRFNDERRLGFEFKFNAEVCHACELRSECTSAEYGRSVFVSHTQLERNEVLSFNASEKYELVMKGERYKIEPRQADLKNNHGLKRARYRSLARVRIQAYLTTMASNLKKWFKKVMGLLKDGTLKTLSLMAALAPPTGEVCLEID